MSQKKRKDEAAERNFLELCNENSTEYDSRKRGFALSSRLLGDKRRKR